MSKSNKLLTSEQMANKMREIINGREMATLIRNGK